MAKTKTKFMWDEKVKLKQNSFQFVKNIGDSFYRALESESIVVDNVIRWFNNGFFLTRDERLVEWESRDGVDLSYTEYTFKLYNNQIDVVLTETTRNINEFNYLTDFMGDYLLIKGGAIYKDGTVFIDFKYSAQEAKHRLLLKVPLENGTVENKANNAANKVIYHSRKKNFQDIDCLNTFLRFLKKTCSNVNEILYQMLLRRYAYHMQMVFGRKEEGLMKYAEEEFLLTNFDLTYLISKIQTTVSPDERLTINYWDKYNSHYSYKEIEKDLSLYFLEEDLTVISHRKAELDKIIEGLDFSQFSCEYFKQLCKQNEKHFELASPFKKGMKVFIQEYQTLDSCLKERKSNLQRIACTYFGKCDFLESKTTDFHLVQNSNISDQFYIVSSAAIKIDLIRFSYKDYLEVLNINIDNCI